MWAESKNEGKQIETLMEIIKCEQVRGNYRQSAAQLPKLDALINRGQTDQYHYLQERLTQFHRSLAEYPTRQTTEN